LSLKWAISPHEKIFQNETIEFENLSDEDLERMAVRLEEHANAIEA
jgi:hypothetical protein